jgi:hypothetical protein
MLVLAMDSYDWQCGEQKGFDQPEAIASRIAGDWAVERVETVRAEAA